jgi:ATP-dependent Zn protease
MVRPEEDQMLLSRSALADYYNFSRTCYGASCFGNPEVTTGASNDLQQVTNIARGYSLWYVKHWTNCT